MGAVAVWRDDVKERVRREGGGVRMKLFPLQWPFGVEGLEAARRMVWW